MNDPALQWLVNARQKAMTDVRTEFQARYGEKAHRQNPPLNEGA